MTIEALIREAQGTSEEILDKVIRYLKFLKKETAEGNGMETEHMKRHSLSARIVTALLLLTIIYGCFAGSISAADAETGSFVRTNGRQFCLEDGSEYVIHGIAFENDVFSDSTEPPTGHNNADSYLELAELGFNTVRYYLNYRVLESDDVPYEYLETGFAWLDENVKWAKDAGIRLLLNLHFPQGGYQSQGEGDSL